jgi:AcrR family transcriptional regulator
VPRIKADTIADHVAQQRAAVLDAAVRLFVERGYAEVGLADVAAEVGLARSSLYRYVPDKSHLLVEWYRRTVPVTIAAWEDATAGDDPPAVRLQRWASCYLEWALSPEHQLVAPLTEALPALDEATRTEVAVLHRSMMAVVAGVVAEAGVAPELVDGVVALLAGVALGAARAEAGEAHDVDVRRRLDAAVAAIVTG